MRSSISLAGLEHEIKRLTISSHPWNDPNQWVLKPAGGWETEPDDWDSRWTLSPSTGYMYIATECYITASCSVNMESSDTPSEDQSIIIEANIYEGGSPIEIIRFPNFGKMIDRSLNRQVIVPQDVVSTSSIQKAFYELHIPFSEDIFLWSSAGINMGASPPAPYMFETREGFLPKFRSMTCRIANNRPLKDGNGGDLELAYLRYVVNVYEDPGNS